MIEPPLPVSVIARMPVRVVRNTPPKWTAMSRRQSPIAVLSVAHATLFTGSRVVYAMAGDHLLPVGFAPGTLVAVGSNSPRFSFA
jgi:hypothetical protein